MAEQSAEEFLASFPEFEDRVPKEYRRTLDHIHTMQVNIGYRCNLACKHCHLQCSPKRTELMRHDTMQACLDAFERGGFASLDITGGAPELHPDFAWFLEQAHDAGIRPICRTNLCVLVDPQYAHFAELYARYDVDLVGSLPFYQAGSCDKIRGRGTFDACIEALRVLNEFGFGTGKHHLSLVYNPAQAVLPPAQASLEGEYKDKLYAEHGVSFDTLIAIANNPSGRFAQRLHEKGHLGAYMQRLIDAFNGATCEGMMCRDQISVDYRGLLYDCDFNQALDLPLSTGQTIFDLVDDASRSRHIVFANHCYGCTAGAGSSCGGATA